MDRRTALLGMSAGMAIACTKLHAADGALPKSELRIAQGRLEGFVSSGIHTFRGIPYARPPIGDLRWRAPQRPAAWSGIRDARRFGPAAIQGLPPAPDIRSDGQSEDCLYLNIWTPSPARGAKLPVMLWIHGGGNLGGAGSAANIDGEAMARKGIVVVTINYRLGVFGFLAAPGVGANFAVQDQVAALAWVRDNIADFGGDPGKVTVFGQSAGAVATHALLSCPGADGLYHRAIVESAGFAPAAAPWWSYERTAAATRKLFEMLGARDIDTLRSMPTAKVQEVGRLLSGAIDTPGYSRTPTQLVWTQTTDGTVLKPRYTPWARRVPIMMGNVENEARFYINPNGAYDWPLVERMTGLLAKPRQAEIMDHFRSSKVDPYEALDQLITTTCFTEPGMNVIRELASTGHQTNYYHFRRSSPGATKSNMRAWHSVEIRYVFGNLSDDGYYDRTDVAVSRQMQEGWLGLARTGLARDQVNGAWPLYREADPKASIIDQRVTIERFPQTPLMTIVNGMRGRSS